VIAGGRVFVTVENSPDYHPNYGTELCALNAKLGRWTGPSTWAGCITSKLIYDRMLSGTYQSSADSLARCPDRVVSERHSSTRDSVHSSTAIFKDPALMANPAGSLFIEHRQAEAYGMAAVTGQRPALAMS